MKVAIAFVLFLGVVSATQLDNFKLSTELETAIRSHLSSCTACHIAIDVIKDEAAVKHAKFILQGYCNDVPPKFQKLCQGVANRIFENGFDLAQHYTVEKNCETFCGENSQQFTTETLCTGITSILENIELIMDTFELKVKSVCSTEVDAEGCFLQFQKWRPFITNFLKRSILRVVNEFEPKTLCHIDLTKIPRADAALKMPKFFPQFTR
uniref:Saposin B-type domain-containing protein n=1 Tax=Panagrolaimus superbus TaxID=310955 RepID=A0A914Z4D0_9BILA